MVHYNFSPYNAFDINPVFWADPSGEDSFGPNSDLHGFDDFGNSKTHSNGVLYVPLFERSLGRTISSTNSGAKYYGEAGLKLVFHDLYKDGEAKAKFQKILDEAFGKNFVIIDNNGKLLIKGDEKELVSDMQIGLLNILKKAIKANTEILIDVYNDDKSLFAGDYKHAKIDIGDIYNFGTGDLDNRYITLAHEINEQYEYQTGNKLEYNHPNSSHMNSIKLEATMNGG